MSMPSPNTETVVIAAGTRTVTLTGEDCAHLGSARAILFLNITAASGTVPTLDVKIQAKCQTAGIYIDIPGAAFGQKIAAGTDMLVIAMGVTASANKAVSHPMPAQYRAVCTVGGTTPSFTFSLTAQAL